MVVFVEVGLQLAMCVYISKYPPPWWLFILETYFVSGFLNHSLGRCVVLCSALLAIYYP